ncbi:phospholipase A2 inhibitor and Ly6/PLAUR domain-containing protein-like [Pelobates fuscus]|uniref:phospholipase A2 inhibitor and Ly6/PLAUR domain-containing protein-like n=1 Tax=Pelobates fuscus TaxID=191477 RepID=UPI002FE44130
MMSFMLSAFCMIAIFFNTGNCLKCQKCENTSGDTCSGELENCDTSVDSCLTTLVVTIYGTNTTSHITKSCVSNTDLCYANYNMTFGSVQLYSIAQCCKSDGCNKDNIKLPPLNQTENGVSCPSCLIVGGEKCVPKETIKCTGDQTKCFSYTGGVYSKGKFVDTDVKGCTTEDVCTHPAPTYPATLLKEGYKLTCP